MNVPAALIDEKVHDIGGIRITCKYIDDVYKVAELVKNRRDLEVLEVRDYIKNVKPKIFINGNIDKSKTELIITDYFEELNLKDYKVLKD